ncbi:MAG: efflux RND transporter periplasmic adaptor subunit, partial [Isosphaeraceae bacterium]
VALIDAPGGPVVLLRRGEDRFERRKVTPGLRDGDSVEIRNGLFPGDQVIVVGKQSLAAMFHAGSSATPSRALGSRAAPAAVPRAGLVVQGTVELPTQSKFHVAPRIGGRLARIRIEPGQHVEAGQILAEVDSLPLRNLQLELLRTRLEQQWTRADVDRLRVLVPEAGVARRKLWERESELAVLETELAALRAKLRSVGLPAEVLARLEGVDLARASEEGLVATTVPLLSPAAGVVSHFDAVPGQVLRPTEALFEVHNPSRIWAKGYVFEGDIAEVGVGDEATLSFPSLPGRTATGTVVRIAPELSPGERVLPLWVELDNPGGLLPEGARARLAFAPGNHAGDRVAYQHAFGGP